MYFSSVSTIRLLLPPLLLSLLSPSIAYSLLSLVSDLSSLASQKLYPACSVEVEGKHFLNPLRRLIQSFPAIVLPCSYHVLPLDGT